MVSKDEAVEHAVQAESLRLAGNYSQAIKLFSAAIRVKKGYSWAHAHRASARAALGNFSGAYDDFKRARAHYVNSNQAAWFWAQKAELFRLWARATLMGGGRAQKESEEWRRDEDALEEPGSADSALREQQPPRARPAVDKAFLQMDFAIRLFSKAHKQLTCNPWILAHRGATYTMRYWVGDPDRPHQPPSHDDFIAGVADFTEACALNPGYGWAYAFHAVLAGLHGDPAQMAKAMELIGRACMNGLDRNLPIMRIMMALATRNAGKAGTPVAREGARQPDPFEKAVEYAWQTLQLDNEEAFARYYVAVNMNFMPDREGDDAKHAIRRARTELNGLRARVTAMEGGLDCLEGNYSDAVEKMKYLESNHDIEALSLIFRDPAWEVVRRDNPDEAVNEAWKGLAAAHKQFVRLFNI
ncbi:hypothetical protein WMF18_19955 [Sorangium sp. So ce315]|uniref:hypothetical protein n=1 Tax=Sorangium sp. So ce315 TaxID=3133299 RepID=UPI003F620A0E